MKSSTKHTPSTITVNWSAVGRRIRELRGFDVTQAELASRIGISQAYLSSIERGKFDVGAEILLRIAHQFDKSIEWLLAGEDKA